MNHITTSIAQLAIDTACAVILTKIGTNQVLLDRQHAEIMAQPERWSPELDKAMDLKQKESNRLVKIITTLQAIDW